MYKITVLFPGLLLVACELSAPTPVGSGTRADASMLAPEASEPVDAEPVDAGPVDAGPLDAGPVDAGPLDTGPTDSHDSGATGRDVPDGYRLVHASNDGTFARHERLEKRMFHGRMAVVLTHTEQVPPPLNTPNAIGDGPRVHASLA